MPCLQDIEQLDCCKLLGVFFQSNFLNGFPSTVAAFTVCTASVLTYITRACPPKQSAVVTKAIIVFVSRILYSLPAWGGFLTVELVGKINAFLNVWIVLVICSVILMILICCIILIVTPGHYLHHCLPPPRPLGHLRSHGHNFQLPEYHRELGKKSFITWTLYYFV